MRAPTGWAVVLLLGSIVTSGRVAEAAPAADPPGRVAFRAEDGIATARPDGTDRKVVVRDAGDYLYGSPEVSPDGRRLVFTRSVRGICSTSQAFISDVDGGNARMLVPNLAYDPTWSPDGTFVAVGVDVGDIGRCAGPNGIMTVRADGSQARVISRAALGQPSWSPDGRELVAMDGVGLVVLDSDGSNVRRLATSGHWSPSWSPDGQHIASTFHDEGLGLNRLVVENRDGSRRHVVAGTDGLEDAAWAPDGTELIAAIADDTGVEELVVIDRDGNRRRSLGRGSSPSWQRTPPGECGAGYRLVAADGGVFTFGTAEYLGSMGGARLNSPIVGMAGTADGRGYWLVAADGGVFTFGSAAFLGSMGGARLNSPIVGMAATADGRGYWLVAADGGVFTFGSAAFLGSMGGARLNSPIVGMAATPDGGGYWLVAGDGGVFTFGAAAFAGSASLLLTPQQRAVALTAGRGPGSYRMATNDGQVIAFGGAAFCGSTFGTRLARPVVGAAT